jgi:hypothetical protein
MTWIPPAEDPRRTNMASYYAAAEPYVVIYEKKWVRCRLSAWQTSKLTMGEQRCSTCGSGRYQHHGLPCRKPGMRAATGTQILLGGLRPRHHN